MKSLLFVFIVALVLYWYLDERHKIKKYSDGLPLNLERDLKPKYYIRFYYGANLSNHWLFKLNMECKLPMYFLNSQVTIHYDEALLVPHLETSRRDKSEVWKVIHELCHDSKEKENKEVCKELNI